MSQTEKAIKTQKQMLDMTFNLARGLEQDEYIRQEQGSEYEDFRTDDQDYKDNEINNLKHQ